jgi:hypothetical protein
MRNPARINIFTEKLNELWHQNPDLRFGQLVEILKNTPNMTLPEDPFHVEDHLWLNVINERLKRGDKF